MSIYVIDDHPLMRDAIVMVLRRLRPAENIVELERLDKLTSAVKQHGAPDLFCLDLKLPDTTGCSGVIAVKQIYPDVPIAVYSASPAADMEEACIEAGADTYIEKSASSAELTAVLRGLLMADADAQQREAVEATDPAHRHARQGHEQPRHRDRARNQRTHRQGAPLAPVPPPGGEESHAGAAPRAQPRPAVVFRLDVIGG
jgi:DNA-binding NarL/FixJ family response regulator